MCRNGSCRRICIRRALSLMRCITHARYGIRGWRLYFYIETAVPASNRFTINYWNRYASRGSNRWRRSTVRARHLDTIVSLMSLMQTRPITNTYRRSPALLLENYLGEVISFNNYTISNSRSFVTSHSIPSHSHFIRKYSVIKYIHTFSPDSIFLQPERLYEPSRNFSYQQSATSFKPAPNTILSRVIILKAADKKYFRSRGWQWNSISLLITLISISFPCMQLISECSHCFVNEHWRVTIVNSYVTRLVRECMIKTKRIG